jgi:hypothetical protein
LPVPGHLPVFYATYHYTKTTNSKTTRTIWSSSTNSYTSRRGNLIDYIKESEYCIARTLRALFDKGQNSPEYREEFLKYKEMKTMGQHEWLKKVKREKDEKA